MAQDKMDQARQSIEKMNPGERNPLEYGWDYLVNWGRGNKEYEEKKRAYEAALKNYELNVQQQQNQQAQGLGEKPTVYYDTPTVSAESAGQYTQARKDFASAIGGAYRPTAEQSAAAREAQAQTAQQAAQSYVTGGKQAEQLEQQRQYAEYLRKMIESGVGDSVAQQQFRQLTQEAQRQAASAIASQRGMNPAMAARLIAQEQAQQSQAAAGKSAEIRAQEQAAIRQQYGELLGQTRGQSIEAESRQAAAVAQMQQALRAGDQDAVNSVFNSLNNLAQIDMSKMSLEQQATLQREQQALQQKIEEAKILLQQKMAEIQRDLDQQKIDQKQAEDQRDFWTKLIISGLVAAGATALAVGTGGLATPVAAAAVSAAGGVLGGVLARSKGGLIKGKAKKTGDSEENDTVPALLSPGEIVIPRSIAQSKNADKKSAEFVRQVMKLESSGRASKRTAMNRISRLEAELAALKSSKSNARK